MITLHSYSGLVSGLLDDEGEAVGDVEPGVHHVPQCGHHLHYTWQVGRGACTCLLEHRADFSRVSPSHNHIVNVGLYPGPYMMTRGGVKSTARLESLSPRTDRNR